MFLRCSLVLFLALLCSTTGAAQSAGGPPLPKPLLAIAPDVQKSTSPDASAIVELLERYFTGFARMDADLMAAALHADATVTGGVGQPSLMFTPYGNMLGRLRQVGGKTTPPVIHAERAVTWLDLRDPLATARVSMKYLPPTRGAGILQEHLFQLYKADGRWQIISTVMHAGQYEGQTDERTLDDMGIKPGMTIGEIGAGDGRITFALARRVGSSGKVYANDIDPKALEELAAVRQRRGVTNIETVVGKADDPMFPKASLDLAIAAITYHHLTHPVALLRNLVPSLKPGATLVILDPAYDRTGDKDSDRPTTRERVEAEAAEAGYELVAIDASLPRDNIFILRVKTGGVRAMPRVTARPWTPPAADADRAAVLATVSAWWEAHDADEAERLDRVMAPGTRSWFEEEEKLQYISYSKELERIRSGKRRPKTRPLPGEQRTVIAVTQPGNVAAVTMRVEIPRGGGVTSRSLTTFQLYKADDRWQIVNLAGCSER